MASVNPAPAEYGAAHKFHFDRLLEDKSNFQPKTGHFGLEIKETIADGSLHVQESILAERDVTSWVHKTTPPQPMKTHVRLLVFTPRDDFRPFMPFSVSEETFKEVFNAIHIPPVFLRALTRNLPLAMRFTPNLRTSKGPGAGLIIRTDAFSFSQYGFCLVYNPETECTTAVCIGLRHAEYKQYVGYLKGALQAAGNYMLLPMVFVDFMNHMSARWLTYNRLSLLAIANCKEIRVRETGDDRGFLPDQELSLDAATRKLTFLNDEYSITESIAKTQLRVLEVIEKILVEQQAVATASSSPGSSVEGADVFLADVSFHRESFKSALQYIERDRHNISGLAQTTYCLIAQKESRQNLMMAEASRRIAEESKKVALWTRRDSSDMRVITAITLLFLPGTFTATLFSSSFFNFKPSDDGRVVSSWSWVYWVTTALLTGIVLVAWFIVFRVQNRKMATQMKTADQVELTTVESLHSAITGFWTSRGASGIWSERSVKADEVRINSTHGAWSNGVQIRQTEYQSRCTASCGGGGGGCGGGCGGG